MNLCLGFHVSNTHIIPGIGVGSISGEAKVSGLLLLLLIEVIAVDLYVIYYDSCTKLIEYLAQRNV